MKNPITEYKNRQKTEIITQLTLAYKIAEDLAKSAVNADAGMHAMLNHLEAVIDCTRGKLKKRVEFAREKILRIWKENEDSSIPQAYLEVEFTLFGMLVGYKGTDNAVDKPHGLKASLANVTEKMAGELLKRQEETKKQADLAEKMVGALGSVKTTMDKMTTEADKLKIELTKAKIDAEMEKGLAYEEGVKAGKKEIQIKKE